MAPSKFDRRGDDGSPDDRSPSPDDPGEVTRLLQEWAHGDAGALEALMPLVFDELRQLAKHHFRRERGDHTLQPTALVNEVYLRLSDQRRVQWDNRSQFFAFAGQLMRRILVDHARAKKAEKRGEGVPALSLDEALGVPDQSVDVVALDDALRDLERRDERQARLVELRVFVGLTIEEAAEVLDIGTTTLKREWKIAKLFLHRQMRDDAALATRRGDEDF